MANISSNITVAEAWYCPIECLEKKAAFDAILVYFFVFCGCLALPLFSLVMMVIQGTERRMKEHVKKLVWTPKEKREPMLRNLCELYKLEYIEVEDDGEECGGY